MQGVGKNQEKTVCCPYNSSHTMPESRLLWHISSGCKDKQLYGHLYETCPHNPYHIYKRQKMEEHIRKCPDKQNSIAEDLGISEADLMAAINNQFKSDKNKEKKAQEEERERIHQNNLSKLGYNDHESQSSAPKKKRIRKKKDKNDEAPKEKPTRRKRLV